MSGHSKWSQIKHQKGKTDKLKGQTFTRLGRAITIAVKESGGISDPDTNFRLRLSIEKARDANMPKNNIDRAIARGLGKGESGDLEHITYEGFGPGNTGLIVEASTDNRQRTNQTLKSIFSTYGGHLGAPGSVSYLFKPAGKIVLQKKEKSEDQYTELAVEAGGNDVVFEDEKVIIYTDPTNITDVKERIVAKGEVVESDKVISIPLSYVTLSESNKNKLEELAGALLEIDDIIDVNSNAR